MASELRLTTLANNAGTESVDTTYVINGSAKAWCRYNSVTSTSFYDSFNCASLVDYGTAYTGINLTSAMSSANWSSVTAGGTPAYRIILDTVGSGTKTTSLVRTYASHHDGTGLDIDDGNMTALGDLA
jgi:hypothetical protein